MYYFKGKYMVETEFSALEYLSRTFTGLSVEKKDYVLNTAKSLIKIQDDDTYSTFIEESESRNTSMMKV